MSARMTAEEFQRLLDRTSLTLDGGAVVALQTEAERARDGEAAALLWLELVRESLEAMEALRLEQTTDDDDVSFSWEELHRVRLLLPRLREALGRRPATSPTSTESDK